MLNETHVARIQEWDSADVEFLHRECNRHIGIGSSSIEDEEKN